MQITVQKIWPLDPTKKSGGFKATDGVNYYCEIGAYYLLSEGTTYEANPTPYVSKLGKSSYIMPKNWHPPTTIAGGNGASPPPTSPPYPPTATNQPAPPPLNPSYNQTPAPQAINPQVAANVAAYSRPSNGDKSGEMFVMGVVGRALGSGKFETQDVPLLAQAAVQAWNDHVRGKV